MPVSRLADLPAGVSPDILVIAGEHSGDQHAAAMVRELKSRHPELSFAAVGGPALEKAGAHPLFDLTAWSVVGLVEVLKHYGDFKALFNELIAWMGEHRPSLVVLVDYPGFNLRLAKALKKEGISRAGGGWTAVYQYISPQIWAWKAKRRFAMAEVLDGLGAIFPFELDCYADTRLPVSFVGHPFVEEAFVNPVRFDSRGPLLMLPGSRVQAVERIFPEMLKLWSQAEEKVRDLQVVVLYPDESIRGTLNSFLQGKPALRDRISLRSVEEGAAGRAVMTSSGTMSLCCALAGLPGMIVYKAHPLTYRIGRSLVRIPYLGIANILLNRETYPEFVQKIQTPPARERLRAICLNPDERAKADADAGEIAVRLTASKGEGIAGELERFLPKD